VCENGTRKTCDLHAFEPICMYILQLCISVAVLCDIICANSYRRAGGRKTDINVLAN
jgi:hypothetical protein